MYKIESREKDTPWYNKFPIAGMFFIIGLSLVIAYFIYFWFADLTPYIIEEDNLVESISAFFYLLSFFLALRVLRIYRVWQKFLLFVAVVGFVGFLDEVSFGERVFNLDMPTILGVKIDALHDFVAISYISLKETIGFYGLIPLLSGSGIIVVGYYIHQQKYSLKNLFGDLFETSPGKLLVLFIFILITATIIDLKEDFIPLVIIEELLEMYAGLILCLCSLSLAEREEQVTVTRSATPIESVRRDVRKLSSV